jgi:DNA polymerase-1
MLADHTVCGPRGSLHAKVKSFSEIWLISSEFERPSGERPLPTTLRAREVHSGRSLVIDMTQRVGAAEPLLPYDSGSLFVAYDAPASLGCLLSLDWPLPARILDLEVEFRCHISGMNESGDWSLVRALAFYEAEAGEDVLDNLHRLLSRMLPIIDLDRALLRGRYAAAVAHMERQGIPVDRPLWARLRASWPALRVSLIEEVDRDYGVFDGTTFKAGRWARWLEGRGIPWPRLGTGGLAMDDDTFKRMAIAYPDQIGPMWELRKTLNRLRVEKLAIGPDGRNRTPLRPFTSKTGRNQPSTSRFIFGSAAWVRGLIRPEPGTALAYVDYEQQEFGIAGALSGDEAMMAAYESGDPYLAFARQAGAVPDGATRETHREERERFKLCALGIQYGMGPRSLAPLLGGTEAQARDRIASHKKVYRRYWEWSRATERDARESGVMRSVFGWKLNVRASTKSGTIRNFPLQANGAEILRLACCLLVEGGIRVCAPVHDAVLIEAPLAGIEGAVALCQEMMSRASSMVLDGYPLRTEAKVVRFPDRFMDVRGERLWREMIEMMGAEGT